MPDLVLKGSGRSVFVPSERLADALASGLYEAPSGDQSVAVTMDGPVPLAASVPVSDLERTAATAGVSPESESSFRTRERSARIEREQGGVIGGLTTAAETALDEATLGGFGALGEVLGGQDYTERRLERQEANPIIHGGVKAGTIVGTTLLSGGAGAAGKLARATPLGAITAKGAKIAAGGTTALGKAARVGLGGAVEGGATGFGQGVQELVATDDPLTIERIASTLGTSALTGAAYGAGANLAAAGAGKALRAAKKGLDDVAARGAKQADVAEDLAALDAKGLRAAKQSELDAIEAGRVTERATVAEDLATFRKATKEQKLWLATKDVKDIEGLGAVGKRTLKADRALDRLLDNPKALAARPQRALDALQQQESALDDIVRNREALLAKYADDTSDTRRIALQNAEAALERNRALQAKLADLTSAPKSTRLDAIQDAADALTTGGGKKSFAEQVTQGSVFSGVTGAVAGLGIPGAGLIAPLLGGKVASAVTEKLFGSLGKSATQAAARTSKAVDAFLDVGRQVAPSAPVLATKALSAVRYAPEAEKPAKAGAKAAGLAELYKTRADELRSLTAYDSTGQPRLKRNVRERIAAQLAPIAQADPLLADRLEAVAVRRLEFLARKLPRRPDVAGIQAGPDRWQPSDFAMRGFARSTAAVEDPGGIEERLVDGTITPEDAEVMREVYPERLADLTRQILERLPELQETLPYERRLALSILTGVPVDPAMDPRILRTLQASFAAEPGTEGGTQAPKPMPQFGSVRNQEPTASQRRQGVTQ